MFFYSLVIILALMPFRVIYILSDFLAFILHRLAGYRKRVVLENLKSIFPELQGIELQKLVREIYRNVSDIVIEGIKAFSMSKEAVNLRHVITNPEILDPYFQRGQSIIVVTGHYGNWEWGAFSASLQTRFKVVGFYKPLRNKRIDRFARESRSKYGTELASIYGTPKAFEENKGQAVIYLMAADQSPSNREKAYFVNFLGRDTAFLHGPEKYARQYNFPVMYVDIRRVKRGYYRLEMSLLSDDASGLQDGEITQRFADKLGSVIRETPANWLWTHRRWKLTR